MRVVLGGIPLGEVVISKLVVRFSCIAPPGFEGAHHPLGGIDFKPGIGYTSGYGGPEFFQGGRGQIGCARGSVFKVSDQVFISALVGAPM